MPSPMDHTKHQSSASLGGGTSSIGHNQEPADVDDGLLATGLPLMISAYVAALAIAAYTFFSNRETLFALVVCLVYGVMYFGIPILMARIRNHRDDRWQHETSQRHSVTVSIYGGSIRRGEALLQMIVVPFAVLFAFAAFAIIWFAVGP